MSGAGREPMTLSTAIFSGRGVSNLMGADSKLNARSPATCTQ